jgi:hypothetical protein
VGGEIALGRRRKEGKEVKKRWKKWKLNWIMNFGRIGECYPGKWEGVWDDFSEKKKTESEDEIVEMKGEFDEGELSCKNRVEFWG